MAGLVALRRRGLVGPLRALVLSWAAGASGSAPEPAEPPAYTGWATWTPGWLWPFWGIALAVATSAYYHRRRDRDQMVVGPHLRQGASR